MAHKAGDKVSVAVETIQRSNGAAWRGDQGKVIGRTGDGYRVKFGDGFNRRERQAGPDHPSVSTGRAGPVQ